MSARSATLTTRTRSAPCASVVETARSVAIMTEQSQTTDPQAMALYEIAAKMFNLVPWEQADDESRELWLRTVREMREIGKGISYDD